MSGTTTGCSRGRRDLEPFDRAEDGDGRRDDAVAVEQRRAEDDEPGDPSDAGAGRASAVVRSERQEREDAALSAVVRPHDEGQVLHRDDHRQRPEDEREDAEEVLVRAADAVVGVDALA